MEKLEATIENIVTNSKLDEFIREKLNKVKNNDDLVVFFRHFTLYNLAFPGGVAALAGAFHIRSDIFRDKSEAIWDNSDRSSLIASNIIFAAEDEFALKKRKQRITHRMLAQKVVSEAIAYAGWSIDRFNAKFENEKEYSQKALDLNSGYRVHSMNNDEDLFFALGFHLGSERLADIEFTELDNMLCANFPDFVKHTKKVKGEGNVSVYSWINLHTVVEIEHYDFSLVAADQAAEFYVGTELTGAQIRNALISGFNHFVDFQRDMFDFL